MSPSTAICHDGLSFEVWDGVYEPAEDSFMLLEAALAGAPGPKAVLEIGTGCGLVAIMLARAGCPLVVATDLAPQAIGCAKANAKRLAPRVHFLASDMFSAVKGSFDLVVFNPPYLPVERGGSEDVAWAGGKTGRDLIDRFLAGVAPHLREGGSALLVQSSLDGLDRSRRMAAEMGLEFDALDRESFFFESLYVVRLSR